MIITTIVNKDYQRFVPWFVLFITKSYPDYKVKIYLTEEIIHGEAFEFVKTENVTYVENSFPEYPKSNQELKTLLFLTKGEANENVYMAGDVDVLICRERPTLENFHLKLCKLTGMIYNSYARFGTERIKSCAHFVTPEYWKVMDEIIDKYRELHKKQELNFGDYDKGMIGNEHVLYKMLREAGQEIISIPEALSSNVIHGFHLGVWRMEKYALPRFIGIQPLYYLEWYKFFLEVAGSFEFKKLAELLPLYEINRLRANMDNYIEKRNAKTKTI